MITVVGFFALAFLIAGLLLVGMGVTGLLGRPRQREGKRLPPAGALAAGVLLLAGATGLAVLVARHFGLAG